MYHCVSLNLVLKFIYIAAIEVSLFRFDLLMQVYCLGLVN